MGSAEGVDACVRLGGCGVGYWVVSRVRVMGDGRMGWIGCGVGLLCGYGMDLVSLGSV